jgi:hypothetical protein
LLHSNNARNPRLCSPIQIFNLQILRVKIRLVTKDPEQNEI